MSADERDAKPAAGPEDLVSVAEAAKLLRVSRSTIWRWIDRGILPACRVGPKRVFVRRDDVGRAKSMPMTFDRERPQPLSNAEKSAARAALAELRRFRDEEARQRGGEPFPDSADLIRQMREERLAELA